MRTSTHIELSPEEIKRLMKEAIEEHEKEKNNSKSQSKLYSLNQVKDFLGCSHTTVKKLVKEGVLKTTADQRRIPAWALNEYLNNIK